MTAHAHKPTRGITDSWITPREILEAVGDFDLDPCACTPQPWPTAKRMISLPQDGLAATWRGCVWLNPPYGPDASRWIKKLAEHGDGMALVFARVETEWFFRYVWDRADAVLFLRGRLHFHTPDGARAKGNAGAPSVLVAYGADCAVRLIHSGLAGRFVSLT